MEMKVGQTEEVATKMEMRVERTEKVVTKMEMKMEQTEETATKMGVETGNPIKEIIIRTEIRGREVAPEEECRKMNGS